ncbi:hypothetical protein MRX96_010947 [Rhipicephalus microplus]
MASAAQGLLQPPQLDFDNALEWPAWLQMFANYRFASSLKEHLEEPQDRNLVYESTHFHRRWQIPGKSVDHFITALHVRADQCDFSDCKERLVRDWFVVGLRDEKLSESVQMDGKLTLVSALFGFPSRMHRIMHEMQCSRVRLESVRKLCLAGCAVTELLMREALVVFPNLRNFRNFYGVAECCGLLAAPGVEEIDYSDVGFPTP